MTASFDRASVAVGSLRAGVALLPLAAALAACALPPAAEHAPSVLAIDVFASGATVDLLTFDEIDGVKLLRHRRSLDGAETWSAPATIDRSGRGIVDHHRGMDPQIASAGDTIVVLWTMPGTSAWGSGPMATAVSRDGGRSWTAGPNPADDGSTDEHGFLDLAVDEAGTFHAFWLDSRDGSQGLRGAVSGDGGRSWSPNRSIDRRTCECCWNKALGLGSGSVGVLYRDKDPRDMALAVSEDRGETWSRRGSAGAFGWQLDGCPHVGGGLARAVDGTAEYLHATVWTGAEPHAGAHVLRSPNGGRSWSPPVRLGSARAKHTDIAASGSDVAAVWDDVRDGRSAIFAALSNDHGETWGEPVALSEPQSTATHPLVIWTGGRFMAFWTERDRGGDGSARLQSAEIPSASAAR